MTYPNKTPPKATNKPIAMAGHDFPGVPSGFFNKTPILKKAQLVESVFSRLVVVYNSTVVD